MEETRQPDLINELCVYCRKPYPTRVKSYYFMSRTKRGNIIKEVDAPDLPWHEECLKKFALKQRILYPLILAAIVWFTGWLIFTKYRNTIGCFAGGIPVALIFGYLGADPFITIDAMDRMIKKWKRAKGESEESGYSDDCEPHIP